jgi:hypothetical protein
MKFALRWVIILSDKYRLSFIFGLFPPTRAAE